MKRTIKELLVERSEKRAKRILNKKLEQKAREAFLETVNYYMIVNNCSFQEAYEHMFSLIK